jgi:hypothetical protein
MDDRRAAAARLRHDLGRYIRFWAPEALEADTEALRERLRRDVLATRSEPEGIVPAAAIFERWLSEEGALFGGSEALGRLRAAMAEVRDLASRLAVLERRELERLDELTRVVSLECRRLATERR